MLISSTQQRPHSVHLSLLVLLLWTALSATCAQAQLSSSKPVTMAVAYANDTAELAAAALCDYAIITAVWQGCTACRHHCKEGNGTSLILIRASAKTAIIDGGSTVQLFVV
eukprot:1045-Heterococcus_DN1.PRE.1